MKRLILLVFILGFQTLSAQETEIKNQIALFFKGLESGDSTLVAQTISSNILMETAFKDKQGVEQSRRMDRGQFLSGVASKKPEDVYQEKLLSYNIQVDGNLASVWTPYEFYYNGSFSHCGSNSFQMVRNEGVWKIVYIIDVRKRNTCKALESK